MRRSAYRRPGEHWRLAILVLGLGVGIVTCRQDQRELLTAMLPDPDLPDPKRLMYYGPADLRWTMQTPDGQRIDASRFAGKVIFLNFWATWCLPCRAELPSLERLSASLDRDDIAFLLVSNEDTAKVRAFVKEERLSIPVYTGEEGFPPSFDVRSVPTTVIVDRNETIVFQHVGAANWDHEDTRRFLLALAGGSAGADSPRE